MIERGLTDKSNENQILQTKNTELLETIKQLETSIDDLCLELKWYKNKDDSDIDYKRKLDNLKKEGN